jgi:hypothetical protein
MSPFTDYVRALKGSPWWGVLHVLLPNKLDEAVAQAIKPWAMSLVPDPAKRAIAARQCKPDRSEKDPTYVISLLRFNQWGCLFNDTVSS